MDQRTSGGLKQLMEVFVGQSSLEASLTLPRGTQGIVVFAHGSGSDRHSPRNRYVADVLHEGGIATLLVDLLTQDEKELDHRTSTLRFDMELLASRLLSVIDALPEHEATRSLRAGLFGSSTGAAAALIAATFRPDDVYAVVCRGGRTDLAAQATPAVRAPTLLIVGSSDEAVLGINRQTSRELPGVKRLEIIAGAGHLFEEPGALNQVAHLARDWYQRYLGAAERSTQAGT